MPGAGVVHHINREPARVNVMERLFGKVGYVARR
jgi:hypothetical protein